MNASLWPMNELLAKDAEIERLKAEKQHAGVECIAYIGDLAEAKVEIERLKEENAMMTEQAIKFRDMVVEKRQIIASLTADLNEASDCNISYRKLITELADALDWWAKHKDYDPEFAVELKKRAREATK